MMSVQEQIVVAYPSPIDCPACLVPHRRLLIANELRADDDVLGIEAIVKFADCGTQVPEMTADPAAVAWWLEMCGDEG